MWVIISTSNCPWCDKAEDLIWERDEEAFIKIVNLHDLENRWVHKLMKEAGLKTVPQIFTPEGEHLKGYEALLDFYFKGKK